MSDGPYFDGDPATDSARRHMERVLKGEPTRKWPWLPAAPRLPPSIRCATHLTSAGAFSSGS
jgi:hypothetical protein